MTFNDNTDVDPGL